MSKRIFKVGDLVMLTGLELIIGHRHVKNGAVGIVTEVLVVPVDQRVPSILNFWFDYMVLVNGSEIMLFEEEVKPFLEDYNPCDCCGCDPCDCDWGVE